MKENEILKKLGDIDEKYILEASPEKTESGKRFSVKWVSALAACLALALAVGGIWRFAGRNMGENAISKNGVHFVLIENFEPGTLDIVADIRAMTEDESARFFGEGASEAFVAFFEKTDVFFLAECEYENGVKCKIWKRTMLYEGHTVIEDKRGFILYSDNDENASAQSYSEIDGTAVEASYAKLDGNTVMVFMSFYLGDNYYYYLEASGAVQAADALAADIYDTASKLIALGAADMDIKP